MTAPAVELPTETCRSCGAPVIWCVTVNADSMPVNADPVAGGNIAVEYRGTELKPLARVLTVAQQFGRINLRTSHFASCPQSARWRRKGGRS